MPFNDTRRVECDYRALGPNGNLEGGIKVLIRAFTIRRGRWRRARHSRNRRTSSSRFNFDANSRRACRFSHFGYIDPHRHRYLQYGICAVDGCRASAYPDVSGKFSTGYPGCRRDVFCDGRRNLGRDALFAWAFGGYGLTRSRPSCSLRTREGSARFQGPHPRRLRRVQKEQL
jgi:hypothetical protein